MKLWRLPPPIRSPDAQPTSVDIDVDNVVASLEWLDEKMGTANLDLVPENLEKVCLETWFKRLKGGLKSPP